MLYLGIALACTVISLAALWIYVIKMDEYVNSISDDIQGFMENSLPLLRSLIDDCEKLGNRIKSLEEEVLSDDQSDSDGV